MRKSADFMRDPISDKAAFTMLDRWCAAGSDLGLIYLSSRKQMYARATVKGRDAGSLQVRGHRALLRLALDGARYSYGPLQVFPQWPLGPMRTVTALEVHWRDEAWLYLFGADTGTPAIGSTPPLIG